jgi:hypothetical protein
MKNRLRVSVSAVILTAVLIATLLIWWRFKQDIELASARAAQGSVLVATRCGPIEYQERGSGVPLLMVHGSGDGHDQGMAFAGGAGAARHSRDCDVALWLPAHAHPR